MERDFKTTITYDGASHYGVRRQGRHGNYLRYCARFVDEGNDSLNFLSLNFQNFLEEVFWLFPPKSMETRFLQYYLGSRQRPSLLLLILQRQELPSCYTLAQENAAHHRKYPNQHYLTRAVRNRTARAVYRFSGVLHVFLFPAVLWICCFLSPNSKLIQ